MWPGPNFQHMYGAIYNYWARLIATFIESFLKPKLKSSYFVEGYQDDALPIITILTASSLGSAVIYPT